MLKSIHAICMVIVVLMWSSAEAQEKLSRILTLDLERILKCLDGAEKAVEQQDTKDAEIGIEEAEKYWKTFQEWNKGKYDPQHPDIVVVIDRMKKAKKKVEALTHKAADMTDALPAVLEVITENEKKLKDAIKTGRMAFMNFQSDAYDYQNIEKSRKKLQQLSLAVERVNTLVPDAQTAAKDFRKQFPDFSQLDKLVQNGSQAGQAVERVEKAPKDWLEELKLYTKECLDAAEEEISYYEKKLQDVLSKEDSRKSYHATNAKESAVELADLLLQVVPVAFPEFPDEIKPVLPDFVEARADFLARAEDLEDRSKKIASQVSHILKDMVDAKKQRLKAARFPKPEYQGSDWEEANKAIRTAWAKKILDKELVKVSIYSPWEERADARWRNDRWVVGTYRYIGAYCLGKLSSGKHLVYCMSFRNTKQPDGQWSELEQWSVGHVYEILAENIDK